MAGWQRAFDAYRAIQTTTLPSRINLLTGSGQVVAGYSPPAAEDIQEDRFTMGDAAGRWILSLCELRLPRRDGFSRAPLFDKDPIRDSEDQVTNEKDA
jgi:hypothetical protein